MSNQAPKLPNPNAVKELRDCYNKRKEERKKHYGEIGDAIRKQNPSKKTARPQNPPDAEV